MKKLWKKPSSRQLSCIAEYSALPDVMLYGDREKGSAVHTPPMGRASDVTKALKPDHWARWDRWRRRTGTCDGRYSRPSQENKKLEEKVDGMAQEWRKRGRQWHVMVDIAEKHYVQGRYWKIMEILGKKVDEITQERCERGRQGYSTVRIREKHYVQARYKKIMEILSKKIDGITKERCERGRQGHSTVDITKKKKSFTTPLRKIMETEDICSIIFFPWQK